MSDESVGQGAPARRVTVERKQGGIAVATLEHPSKLNVLDREGWALLGQVFSALAEDDAVLCVVVRGAGSRAFSAGSDIGAFAEQRDTPEQVRRYAADVERGLTALRECPHPTVAAVEGVCAGGGLAVAASCDVRVCGQSSRFGVPVNRLGLTMSYDEMAPVLAAIGPGAVLELLLTGEFVDAKRAREIGLATRLVPDGHVVEEALRLAGTIAAGAPLVNRWHKRFVRRAMEGSAVSRAEQDEAYESFRTRDYREGRAAFVEKRAPRFTGE